LLVAIASGATVIILNPVVPPKIILNRITNYNVSILCANPTILKLLLTVKNPPADFNWLHSIYTSGAIADRNLIMKVMHYFKIKNVLNVYGLTEAGPRVSAQRINDPDRIPGAVGYPVQNVKIKINNDTNNMCKKEKPGIIHIQSASMMLGYWNDNAGTEEKLRQGWLNTNDLGYWAENGELVIVGRNDELLNRAGYKIVPDYLESVINTLDEIQNVVIFGIPDYLQGHKIICAYQTKNGRSIRQKIMRHCRKHLLPSEYPQEFLSWKDIPLTSNGKVSRKKALEKYMHMCKE
jgi:long-chain acyl-CoA synthetase